MSAKPSRFDPARAVAAHRAKRHARRIAEAECFALLVTNDPVKNLLADGNWEAAAHAITDAVVDAYEAAMEKTS